MQHTARLTAAADLQTIVDHWDKLRALIDTSQSAVWPPARGEHGTVRDQHDPDDPADADHVQHLITRMHALGTIDYECLHCDYVGEGHGHTLRPDRDPAQLGERPVPIRLHVVDTMRAIEDALLYLADTIAAEVQRPAMSHASMRARRPVVFGGWLPAERERRDQLADEDAADDRRWRYPGGRRDAVSAAEWLQDRLSDRPGPFVLLADRHHQRIATVARESARRVRSAIGTERTHRVLNGMPCPGCKGELTFHQGGGEPDIVSCSAGLMDCTARAPWHPDTKRREWDGEDLVKLLQKLEAARREIREIRARQSEDQRRAKRAADRKRQRAAVRERVA